MTPIERYQQLHAKAEELKQRISRAEGALEQHMNQLQGEFGCSTIEEAQEKLNDLQAKALKAKQDFETAADVFEDNWREVLNS